MHTFPASPGDDGRRRTAATGAARGGGRVSASPATTARHARVTDRPRTALPAADPTVPRHGRERRNRRVLRAVGTGALGVGLFLGTGGALAYTDIQGNVQRQDITDLLGERPDGGGVAAPLDAKAGQALNILIMGSDSRDGANDDSSGVGGMRADTTMIAHVAADRSRVEIVSIPRDTLVDIPSCTLPDGSQTSPHDDAMFNSAFAIGGQTGDVGAAAACTIRTVEDLTGVFIDDFVVVDFAGFINMVDALGGVPMYIPEPISDSRADLELQSGCQVLDGHDALGFARVRKSMGDGSDISRIGRQQELVAAIAREALSKNLLTDLPALYQFLDAATATLTTGAVIGQIPTLAGLASSLRGLDPADISFATMPFDWAGSRVVPSAQADDLWDALAADQPIEATLTGTGEAPAAETSPTPQPAEQPVAQPSAPGPTSEATPITAAPAGENADAAQYPSEPTCTK
ncbi:LCP family protein [Georgenia sp. AZ-5]|uniref:LCP family glycopolymer transferase n=1 Tax=Georgenia sp. AZ-5 TaxID=3367526 RepID=UPI00375512F6